MKEMTDFLEKHGDSTILTCKIFSEIEDSDLLVLKTGIGLQINALTNKKEILFVVEEVDEEMAELMQDYRGYLINVAIPCVLSDDDSIALMKEFSYGLNFLKLKHDIVGFRTVENNV